MRRSATPTKRPVFGSRHSVAHPGDAREGGVPVHDAGDLRTGTNPYNITFTYDPAGNRLTRVKDTVTTNYSYDAADRMTVAGSDTYGWNANGAQTSKVSGGVTTSFDWDFDDYMTKITQGATVVEFKYDGLKRRAQRLAGGVTRNFLYSGDQIMAEKEGATLVAEYMLARGMIFREASGVKETYHFDWIGSTRALTDAAQTVTATYNYEAFGTVVGSTGSSGNTYKFDGAWRYRDDGDFGLVHVGARYYEPATGRWVSKDVVWIACQGFNGYTYVDNSSPSVVDPKGFLAPLLVAALVVAGGAVLGGLSSVGSDLLDDYLGDKPYDVDWSDVAVDTLYGCTVIGATKPCAKVIVDHWDKIGPAIFEDWGRPCHQCHPSRFGDDQLTR